ncbi:MAG: type IV pilus twitching motility protein PilT [Anaerovoracaceae bacterium]|nr:type IV pilus twitching motility protein PilT [Bacillota bacterium]MDD7734922.1 type IV pilus twitching motility protein PilT [Bacillota bacterium]MDY5905622.1 type IV pilus twitching motility protein PilT [Anaerovoracaceae bacterium]
MHYGSIDEMLKAANERGASDLHITVGVPPKIRIDGELIDIADERIMPADAENLIMPIIPDHARKQLVEMGESDFSYAIAGVGRYRVNAFRQRGSYACVIRIVGTRIPSPQELGLPESVVALTELKRGLVIVTGPTGSGKSTTLASLVDVINSTQNVNVITLEDPIEYLHRHNKAIVNQREIGVDSFSYTSALRAALREDPDVIMVGEMRDLDTISTAITAAETGHLVLSTLHTTGAANTIDRIIDVFPPHQQQQIRIQLAGVLESVISQQLLPKVFGGRVAAFEVMHTNTAIKNLIRESKTHQIDNIIQTNRKLGMMMMDDAIMELYMRGEISKETALEYAQDQQNMKRKLQ